MKTSYKTISISMLSIIGMMALSGCTGSAVDSSTSRSQAWQDGYATQTSLSADLIDDYAEAFAYCTAIQESQYATEDSRAATDYVEGCLEYVTIDAGVDTEETENEDTNSQGAVVGLLARLNNGGSTSWAPDKFAPTGGSPVENIFLGNAPDDGSSCGVWVFGDYATAKKQATGGEFDWVTGYYWWGEDQSGKGIVLIANSNNDTCAIDAALVLDWNLNE